MRDLATKLIGWRFESNIIFSIWSVPQSSHFPFVDCCCYLVAFWRSLFNIVDAIAEPPSSGPAVVFVVVVFSSGSVEQTASGPSRQASRSQAGAAEAMMTICDDVMTM